MNFTWSFIAALIINQAVGYTLVSQQSYPEHAQGEELVLECIVEGADFDALSHVIKWWKTQGKNEKTEEQVTASKLVEGVFQQSGRFEVVYNTQGAPTPKTEFSLKITNTKPEDSGDYRCQIHTNEGVKQTVTHKLKIYVPVDSVEIRGVYDSEKLSTNGTELSTSSALEYNPEVDGYFECLVTGGYPYPIVTVSVGDSVITAFLTSEVTEELVGDKIGLQTYSLTTRRFSMKFNAREEYNGQTLVCKAHVSDSIQDVSKSASITITSSPAIVDGEFCKMSLTAAVGDRGARLLCRYSSRPGADSVTWTAATSGDVIDGFLSEQQGNFQAFVKVEGNFYDAELEIKEVASSSFQQYVLMVKNELGSFNHTIALVEGESIGGSTAGATWIQASLSAMLLTILPVLLTLT